MLFSQTEAEGHTVQIVPAWDRKTQRELMVLFSLFFFFFFIQIPVNSLPNLVMNVPPQAVKNSGENKLNLIIQSFWNCLSLGQECFRFLKVTYVILWCGTVRPACNKCGNHNSVFRTQMRENLLLFHITFWRWAGGSEWLNISAPWSHPGLWQLVPHCSDTLSGNSNHPHSQNSIPQLPSSIL